MAKRQHSDESKPAGEDEQGRPEPAQPASNDQSGSTGRATGGADTGKDTGQDRYGQSGLGGEPDQKTDGQQRYQQSGPDGSKQPEPANNRVSGRHVRKPRIKEGS